MGLSSSFQAGPRAVLLALFALAACDDGSGPVTTPLTIQQLTTQLAEAVGADPPAEEAEKTIRDLAGATCKVMAQDGGCAAPLPAPGASLAASPPAPGILSLLPARRSTWEDALRFEASGPVLAPPPLGATCVWNVDNDGWAGSSPLFGEVPDDRTRFEGYETEAGSPIIPLERTGAFFDVAPILQNTDAEPRGEVTVQVENRRTTGGALVSMLLAGSVDPTDGDVVDLLMSGRSGSSSTSALDYLFSIDRDRVVNAMEIEDLLFVSELDAAGNASFFVQKRNDPRQAIEFVFRVTSPFTIASGDAYIGQDRVATMSGDRGAPVFELLDPGVFDEQENLGFVYEHLSTLDVRVIDLFFFGYCVGANTPEVCNQMRGRFGVG